MKKKPPYHFVVHQWHSPFYVWRHCEFGRAAVTAILDNSLPQLSYLGYIKKNSFAKIHEAVSSLVYDHWDNSNESGPQQRPRDTDAVGPLGLKVLAVNNSGHVVWPESVMSQFPASSAEFAFLEDMRKQFLVMCPEGVEQQSPGRATTTPTPVRSTGRPDFSIDGGKEPLDPLRVVDLAGVPATEFTAERWGTKQTLK